MPPISRISLPLVLLVMLGHLGCVENSPGPTDPGRMGELPATWVGRSVCAECHASEALRWRGSHHDLAMQEASEANILADFEHASFEQDGTRVELSRRGDDFFVHSRGPDGEEQEHRVTHTFGVDPLQQYLLDVGRGALQAFPIAWDTRSEAEGGQRWFHIYDEPVARSGDPLHWMGPLQNWNFMCADCHSTGLRKGYDAATGSFETTWEEIDVSCEACHGPGSRHVEAARAGGTGDGLLVDLRRKGTWTFDDGATTARLVRQADVAADGALADGGQTDTCGRCHSRRTPIAPFEHGESLHDAYSVALLEEPLYHADGQILDEVYVYGSFQQSLMHGSGVTCSDCHEPHSARLRFPGNAVCSQCHLPATYDAEEHHHHPVGGPGTACVDCHMPARNYMVVDPRRDHSFRVPRPDLSMRLGTPNACNGCHGDRDPAWAAETLADWGADTPFHYGEALHAARTHRADAESLLLRVAEDPAQPPIVRASALGALEPYLGPVSMPAVEAGLRDPHPLVRGGASSALAGVEPALQQRLLGPLAGDPMRSVRLQAARILAGASESSVRQPAFDPDLLGAAVEEYRASLDWRSDRPSSHLHLGDLEARRGNAEAAEQSYLRALEMSPGLAAAAVNLADLYRATGREREGEELLRRALSRAPDDAGLHLASGLASIRLGRGDEALGALRAAYELAPEVPRYAYVYGVALHDLGDPDEGIRILETAYHRFPGNRELAAGYRALAGERPDHPTGRQ